MGDPICKWRNVSIETAVELVSTLPKKVMPNSDFRLYMNDSIYGASFLRTAYQTACQMGLYYIDGDNYHPRFDHNIDEEEASTYLHHWIRNYYVPNPYTMRKFDRMEYSVILMYAIAQFVQDHPNLSNLITACDGIFGETTGNILCVRYMLNEYSNIMKIDRQNDITLLQNIDVDPVLWVDRYDKALFFNSFNL
jgi:5-methylcytosine-specific restriction protein B